MSRRKRSVDLMLEERLLPRNPRTPSAWSISPSPHLVVDRHRPPLAHLAVGRRNVQRTPVSREDESPPAFPVDLMLEERNYIFNQPMRSKSVYTRVCLTCTTSLQDVLPLVSV